MKFALEDEKIMKKINKLSEKQYGTIQLFRKTQSDIKFGLEENKDEFKLEENSKRAVEKLLKIRLSNKTIFKANEIKELSIEAEKKILKLTKWKKRLKRRD